MDNVSQIKEKLDIVDVIGGYITLKKSGRNYKALCPFHGEKTPSFMVSPELQIYKCFGCGESGDIFTFVEKMEGVDFGAALETLAEKAGVKLEKENFDDTSQQKKKIYFVNELTLKFYQYLLLKHPAGGEALKYLKQKRKFTEETIKDWGLGYAPKKWSTLYEFLHKKGIRDEDALAAGVTIKKQNGKGYLDKFRGRIIFPLTEIDGKTVGFTARTLFNEEPKYIHTSEGLVFHKSRFLYGLNKARVNIKSEGVMCVEGSTDVITAHQSGIKNLVAPLGTSLTEGQLFVLSRYTKDIAFCFDSDIAGTSAAYRAIDMAEKQNFNIKVTPLPKEYKDLDEMIKAGVEEAKKLLKNAVSAYDFFVADKLKKYNKNTAEGKKRIIEELIPLLGNISNTVLFEHYAKELSKELNTKEETIFDALKKRRGAEIEEEIEESVLKISRKTPEAYFLALIFKSDIDSIKGFLYNLAREDFTNSETSEIFAKLKNYTEEKEGTFKFKDFLKTLGENLKTLATDLYLWEFDKTTQDENLFEKEIESTIKRIKKESVKRRLNKLTEEIKLAEMQGDTKLTEKLTKEFEKTSKTLL